MNCPTSESSRDLTTSEGITELEASIQCRLAGYVREFRLVVVDQGLVLRGHAHTYYAKQLAQQAVLKRTELRILANEIEVSSSLRARTTKAGGSDDSPSYRQHSGD
jgi:hypothetical protein